MSKVSIDPVKALNHRFAYVCKNGGNPIYNAEQMLPKKPLVCKPMGDEWRAACSENKWWATGYAGSDRATTLDYKVRDKLLTFGGEEACVQYEEPDAEAILQRGQLWYGDKVALVKGQPSQCHRNSCDLWEANRGQVEIAIATGYALSKDSMWRQHSWLLLRNYRSVKVIETTEIRIAYFGFVMTDEEAKQFCLRL